MAFFKYVFGGALIGVLFIIAALGVIALDVWLVRDVMELSRDTGGTVFMLLLFAEVGGSIGFIVWHDDRLA